MSDETVTEQNKETKPIAEDDKVEESAKVEEGGVKVEGDIKVEEPEQPEEKGTGQKQYVCIAFDNCGLIESWKMIREFSLDLKKNNKRLPYTFFISAVKLLSQSNRYLYDGPDGSPNKWSDRPKAGQSNIGFGGPSEEVRQRVQQINLAIDEGHEIASHGVGHFFAEKLRWNSKEWSTEFWYFEQLLTKVAKNHQFDEEHGSLNLKLSDIQGFRAPYLQEANGLYPVMTNRGFTYDTSDIILDPGAWPTQFKYSDVWNFGLPLINHPKGKTSANRTGKTIPMDWNWFFFDVVNTTYPRGHKYSGQLMPEWDDNKRQAQKQGMLDTYNSYFWSNYSHPDRPPVHIGHHFKMYNKGIYWEALKEFIWGVIDQPDVEFVTYKELVAICEARKAKKLGSVQPPAQSVKSEMIKLAAMDGPMGCGCECV